MEQQNQTPSHVDVYFSLTTQPHFLISEPGPHPKEMVSAALLRNKTCYQVFFILGFLSCLHHVQTLRHLIVLNPHPGSP